MNNGLSAPPRTHGFRQTIPKALEEKDTPPIDRTGSFAMKKVVVMILAACSLMAAQNGNADPVTKVMALEHAWNQAEQRRDTKALVAIFDNALQYIEYDGSLMTKAAFLARVKSSSANPQQMITQGMAAHSFGSTVIVTGAYIAKGLENGRPYTRRGRFIDTWVFKDGNWVCVASGTTPILR
jgi:tellurite resistance protein